MRYQLCNTPLIAPTAQVLSKIILKLFGWNAVGKVPAHIKKYVAVAAPHTSNWDFPIFLMTAFALGLNAHWMGKHTLFRFPFRNVMTWLGGIPVNRTIRGDMVATATKMLRSADTFAIGISPEGTRRATEHWHTGFWYIAQSAQVPIILAYIDYKTKQCGIYAEFRSSGDVTQDMEQIKDFYATFEGRNPHNFKI
jgi:1-acyl-sn-glycerol-3-phosphate acyltransferase